MIILFFSGQSTFFMRPVSFLEKRGASASLSQRIKGVVSIEPSSLAKPLFSMKRDVSRPLLSLPLIIYLALNVPGLPDEALVEIDVESIVE